MSTPAHVYSDAYIIDVLYIFKTIKTRCYVRFWTPVISAKILISSQPFAIYSQHMHAFIILAHNIYFHL